MFKIIHYRQADGWCPFQEWFLGLRDRAVKARITKRLHNVEAGTLGDFASVGEGIFELRMHFGPGYRIYFGQSGERWVILLCGGDKSRQQRDIQEAKQFWSDWKRRES